MLEVRIINDEFGIFRDIFLVVEVGDVGKDKEDKGKFSDFVFVFLG